MRRDHQATVEHIRALECELLLCDCTEAEHWFTRYFVRALFFERIEDVAARMRAEVSDPYAKATMPVYLTKRSA